MVKPFTETSTNTIDEYLECSCEYLIGLVEDADQEMSSDSKLPNLIQTDIAFYLHLVHILELNSTDVQCIVQPSVTAAVFVRKLDERMFFKENLSWSTVRKMRCR